MLQRRVILCRFWWLVLSWSVAVGSAPAGAQVPAPPCGACLVVTIAAGQAAALPARLAGLEVAVRIQAGENPSAALAEIRRRGGQPGVVIEGPGEGPWPAADVRSATFIVLSLREPSGAAATVFALEHFAVAARAAAPSAITVAVRASPEILQALWAGGIGPYVDAAMPDGDGALPPGTVIWRSGGPLTGVFRALRGQSRPADRWFWDLPADAGRASIAVQEVLTARAVLPRGLVPAGTGDVIRCGGTPLETYRNLRTLALVAPVEACPADETVTVTAGSGEAERLPLAGGVLIRVAAPRGTDRFADDVSVVGVREMSVAEIVAKHQAAAARQALTVRELISVGSLTLTFEAPGFPAPVTIGADTTIYTGYGQTEIAQSRIRVNGMAFAGNRVPRLPIIEPERAAAPPLAITLNGLYRYRLERRDTWAGVACYVVAFEPREAGRPLFRGRAWIAADGFAMVRVEATQTGLRGPIVSSVQIDEFAAQAPSLWLLRRSETRQMYEGASHRTPIHRVMTIERQEVNPPDFRERQRAAHASDAVILRDTADGFRYLRRPAPGSAAPQEPSLAPRASRVRTLAGGVIVDPNISRPLPFAGLSYVDFDLFGTGTQLNAFFGGTYGQVAFAVPAVGRTRWQVGGRASGILTSYNDRAFVNGRERYDADIRQQPAQVSVWLTRPLTPVISLRVGYDLDYTRFAAGAATAAAFRVPATQVAHGAKVAIDGQYRGWSSSVWGSVVRRSGWRPWGRGIDDGTAAASGVQFQRYGATAARSTVISPHLVSRIEAAWMGGRDLDRFSRYAFGTFDNRLRGYPSALIRYDRGGVLRGSLAWAAGRFVRVDGFLDSALAHDPGFGPGLRAYTGIGTAVEVPLPFGTLLAAEWGYGRRGVNSDGRLGTHVFRISAFKVF